MESVPAMGTGAARQMAVRLAEEVMWWLDERGAEYNGTHPCYTRPESDPGWAIHVNNDDDRLIVWYAPDMDGERWDPLNDDGDADDVLERMVYLGWDVTITKQIGAQWSVTFQQLDRVHGATASERRRAICEAALAAQGDR